MAIAGKVIVIGAGLGGVSAAVSLAAKGYSVEVFEKNRHIGGKLNFLRVDGFSFDLGPSLLTMPHIVHDLFHRAGKRVEEYLSIREMPVQWRNFFEDGTRFDLTNDISRFAREMDRRSPGAGGQITDFLSYADKQRRLVEHAYFSKGCDGLRHAILRLGRRFLSLDTRNSMGRSIRAGVGDPYLREMLGYFSKYIGSSADNAPGFLNLLPSIQAVYGVHYIDGGMRTLSHALTRLVDELGIVLRLGSRVTGLTMRRKRVTGVRLEDGSTHRAETVISNMEVISFHRSILGVKPDRLARMESRWEPSCSGLVIHLGLDRTYPHLSHHNFFYSRTPASQARAVFDQKALPNDPTLYVVAPARSDPSLAPPGKEILKILPQVPYITSHGPSTEALNRLREEILVKLERMGLSNLREHIVAEKTLSPLDLQDLYLSNRGSIYGIVSDKRRNRAFKAPQKSSGIGGLWFVGGSVNPGCGMPMVLLGGMQVADRIAKRQ